eukprot:Opistho-2@36016
MGVARVRVWLVALPCLDFVAHVIIFFVGGCVDTSVDYSCQDFLHDSVERFTFTQSTFDLLVLSLVRGAVMLGIYYAFVARVVRRIVNADTKDASHHDDESLFFDERAASFVIPLALIVYAAFKAWDMRVDSDDNMYGHTGTAIAMLATTAIASLAEFATSFFLFVVLYVRWQDKTILDEESPLMGRVRRRRGSSSDNGSYSSTGSSSPPGGVDKGKRRATTSEDGGSVGASLGHGRRRHDDSESSTDSDEDEMAAIESSFAAGSAGGVIPGGGGGGGGDGGDGDHMPPPSFARSHPRLSIVSSGGDSPLSFVSSPGIGVGVGHVAPQTVALVGSSSSPTIPPGTSLASTHGGAVGSSAGSMSFGTPGLGAGGGAVGVGSQSPVLVGLVGSMDGVGLVKSAGSSSPHLGREQQAGRPDRRTNLAMELLKTEETYADGLNVIIEVFLTPLKEAAAYERPVASLKEIRAIFSEIEPIHTISSHLVGELRNRLARWGPCTCLSDVFSRGIMNYLKLYSVYVNNYEEALNVLDKCRRSNAAFRAFVDRGEANPACGRMCLADLLILPVQRIPRYVLLLNDLVRYTAASHPDHAGLREALDGMRQLAVRINEAKRQADRVHRMIAVQMTVRDCPELMGNGRRLIEIGRFVELEGAGGYIGARRVTSRVLQRMVEAIAGEIGFDPSKPPSPPPIASAAIPMGARALAAADRAALAHIERLKSDAAGSENTALTLSSGSTITMDPINYENASLNVSMTASMGIGASALNLSGPGARLGVASLSSSGAAQSPAAYGGGGELSGGVVSHPVRPSPVSPTPLSSAAGLSPASHPDSKASPTADALLEGVLEGFEGSEVDLFGSPSYGAAAASARRVAALAEAPSVSGALADALGDPVVNGGGEHEAALATGESVDGQVDAVAVDDAFHGALAAYASQFLAVDAAALVLRRDPPNLEDFATVFGVSLRAQLSRPSAVGDSAALNVANKAFIEGMERFWTIVATCIDQRPPGAALVKRQKTTAYVFNDCVMLCRRRKPRNWRRPSLSMASGPGASLFSTSGSALMSPSSDPRYDMLQGEEITFQRLIPLDDVTASQPLPGTEIGTEDASRLVTLSYAGRTHLMRADEKAMRDRFVQAVTASAAERAAALSSERSSPLTIIHVVHETTV